jgi:hypothetical protein
LLALCQNGYHIAALSVVLSELGSTSTVAPSPEIYPPSDVFEFCRRVAQPNCPAHWIDWFGEAIANELKDQEFRTQHIGTARLIWRGQIAAAVIIKAITESRNPVAKNRAAVYKSVLDREGVKHARIKEAYREIQPMKNRLNRLTTADRGTS